MVTNNTKNIVVKGSRNVIGEIITETDTEMESFTGAIEGTLSLPSILESASSNLIIKVHSNTVDYSIIGLGASKDTLVLPGPATYQLKASIRVPKDDAVFLGVHTGGVLKTIPAVLNSEPNVKIFDYNTEIAVTSREAIVNFSTSAYEKVSGTISVVSV
jgi:hypothetical protein